MTLTDSSLITVVVGVAVLVATVAGGLAASLIIAVTTDRVDDPPG